MTCHILSDNEIEKIFEQAPPGKEFTKYAPVKLIRQYELYSPVRMVKIGDYTICYKLPAGKTPAFSVT